MAIDYLIETNMKPVKGGLVGRQDQYICGQDIDKPRGGIEPLFLGIALGLGREY